MVKFHLTAIIWREELGFVSKCPELGVSSASDNSEEALKNLREAVELYLENARELDLFDDLHDVSVCTQAKTDNGYAALNRFGLRQTETSNMLSF